MIFYLLAALLAGAFIASAIWYYKLYWRPRHRTAKKPFQVYHGDRLLIDTDDIHEAKGIRQANLDRGLKVHLVTNGRYRG